jgi:TonB-linked SusC/RagA family outer membrane protein
MGNLANAEGRYLILNIPVGTHVLRVELIGYASSQQTVTVGADQTVTADFTLNQTAVSLEEIIVTGVAAEVRAREIGNALDAVTSRELEAVPLTTAEEILGGRLPGVTLMQGGGQPGAGNIVRIRGQVSASSTAEPLIYVDGVRIAHNVVGGGTGTHVGISPLQSIAADDIERIEVVKGASAATLYGTEAAAGVIQIFTKRGISGEPIWSGEVSLGVVNQGEIGPPGDPTDVFTKCGVDPSLIYGMSQARGEEGMREYFFDPTCPSSGSWFKNGLQQRYSLSVRGGMGDVTYFVSGNYSDSDGTLEIQNARIGGLRANLDFSPLEGFRIAFNGAFNIRDIKFVEDGNRAAGFLLNVGRGFSGNFKGGKGDDCANVPDDVICVTNRYLFDQENLTRTDRFTGGLTLQYDPIESLNNRLTIGWDYDNIEIRNHRPWGNLRTPLGYYGNDITKQTKLSIDYAGSWRAQFGSEGDWVSTFSWGGQLFKDGFRWTSYFTEDFAGPGAPSLESGALWDPPDDSPVQRTNAGFFLQEIMGWRDLIFLTAGLRVDGNSAFGEDFGLQAYPKGALAYVISDHEFWPRDWIDTFKLRGAFGYSGKAPGAFDKLRTWSPVSGDEGEPGFTPNDVGNSKVGPEQTREIEVGFDASFLDGRAGLEMTYYDAETTDALIDVNLPDSEGFTANRTTNVGTLTSKGWEFQVSGTLFRNDWLDWSGRANMAFMETEAVDLDGQSLSADNKAYIREGYSVPHYFGRQVLNPNEFADPEVSDETLPIGPVYPTTLLGFTTTVNFLDRFALDALLEHQGGHYLPNYTGYQNGRRGVWYPCYGIQEKIFAAETGADPNALNDVTALDRALCATNRYRGYNSDFWVEKADFWKLRSVSLTFNLPTEWVSSFASSAAVSLQGTNLLKWTDYTGLDPEIEDFADRVGQVAEGAGEYGRREYYNLPPARTFLLSFRVTF